MSPGRPDDRFGVGYYYARASDEELIELSGRESGTQGVEAFYNVAVTPWIGISPDVQWIDGGNRRADDTWVFGLRVTLAF